MAEFPADTPQVNLLVKAYNVPADTTLDIQWIIAKSDDQSILDTIVKEDKLPVKGSGDIVTALISRSQPFIKGDYQVKLLVGTQLIATVPFKIQ